MPEVTITTEPSKMEMMSKKKGIEGTPVIETPDMDVMKEYLPLMKKYLSKMNMMIDMMSGKKEMDEEPDEEPDIEKWKKE